MFFLFQLTPSTHYHSPPQIVLVVHCNCRAKKEKKVKVRLKRLNERMLGSKKVQYESGKRVTKNSSVVQFGHDR